MATTSIWPVKGYLGKLVVYVENPDKVTNPKRYEKPDMTDGERQGLEDVIEYASRSEATVMKKFVTGINCLPEEARDQMLLTKRLYTKQGGRVAFHGYQSFAPGEVTPEVAHEIGVRLAEKLWGDDFEVIVATHLDKDNHIHSHFVLNSVAFTDGHRFHNGKDDYRRMRAESDRLCREYGLSVIEKPVPGKSKHYAEWEAERNGKSTWRGIIKTDVDNAIRASMTDTQFFNALKEMGYEIKMGKDISVRPPGKERFFRLARNFGDGYTLEAIRRRILRQQRPYRRRPQNPAYKRYGSILRLVRRRKVGGLMGLYLHYQYLLGNLPKRRGSPRRKSFALKEDLAKLDMISAETKLLFRNHIETDEQLFSYHDALTAEIERLTGERTVLYQKLKRRGNAKHAEEIKAEAKAITAKLKPLRLEAGYCMDIARRSGVMRSTIAVPEIGITHEVHRKETDRDVQLRSR
jgi:hypothetical protein